VGKTEEKGDLEKECNDVDDEVYKVENNHGNIRQTSHGLGSTDLEEEDNKDKLGGGETKMKVL
jgi:hypothetical protein